MPRFPRALRAAALAAPAASAALGALGALGAFTTRAAAAAATALTLAAPCALAQDANLGRNLAATCANCHGTGGQSRGEVKSLAGLPAESIVAAFNAYKAGTLPATVMHQIAKGYSDEQVKLIAGYLAAQQPKK